MIKINGNGLTILSSRILVLIAGASILFSPSRQVRAQLTIFEIDTTRQNTVLFHADATFGDFTGYSSLIHGRVSWPDQDTLSAEALFHINLATFDTDIELRNQHMREKYLETDRFPKAVYSGLINGICSGSDSLFIVQTSGTLEMHGTKRALMTDVKVYRQNKKLSHQNAIPHRYHRF